jgi:hypothetical protein
MQLVYSEVGLPSYLPIVVQNCSTLENGTLVNCTNVTTTTTQNLTLDYFNVGASVDFIERNDNHMTMFWTSGMLFRGQNYTHVNSVDLIRITSEGSTFYRY